jgi:hypothetical protein
MFAALPIPLASYLIYVSLRFTINSGKHGFKKPKKIAEISIEFKFQIQSIFVFLSGPIILNKICQISSKILVSYGTLVLDADVVWNKIKIIA